MKSYPLVVCDFVLYPATFDIHLLVDINVCDVDNGGCDQICIDGIGSFHCNCTEGYLINDDGFSCDGEGTLLF